LRHSRPQNTPALTAFRPLSPLAESLGWAKSGGEIHPSLNMFNILDRPE
jgi:hypothetical protein